MDLSDKRQLLIDIDTLVKRPSSIDLETIPRTIANMSTLLQDLLGVDDLEFKIVRKAAN